MRPKQHEQIPDESQIYLERSRETGIWEWQELAHLDFQDLIELARDNSVHKESEYDQAE